MVDLFPVTVPFRYFFHRVNAPLLREHSVYPRKGDPIIFEFHFCDITNGTIILHLFSVYFSQAERNRPPRLLCVLSPKPFPAALSLFQRRSRVVSFFFLQTGSLSSPSPSGMPPFKVQFNHRERFTARVTVDTSERYAASRGAQRRLLPEQRRVALLIRFHPLGPKNDWEEVSASARERSVHSSPENRFRLSRDR